MRASVINLEMRMKFYSDEGGELPEYIQHAETATKCVELLAAIGHVMASFPEELQGNEIWPGAYATDRATQFSKGLRGLGEITSAIADAAYGHICEMQSAHTERND